MVKQVQLVIFKPRQSTATRPHPASWSTLVHCSWMTSWDGDQVIAATGTGSDLRKW